ncbi:D-aminoacylase [Vibrio nigripulchritudo SO65]|uniref:N-acyl-D-amino-acid deacylase family protein n=1 Tax=Vibrio nigripulchritudo TaxID=28173 RepID=UPI0003B1C888|nr:D-aminoacylase [Vibrio nigripulchritudo]CCN35171.1 D-aminoacylase [Vibrio nigripulchritudo AM115]CCN42200.1 D-aminoacylase [Vibrio nigripulchritudo FTn2]CCN63059.1 D-aminoacylase [Vibrio nigripulchritudo POn4]CCN75595.1 D-aminoacylase [Vibrio nigripulchritudo SO65]
MHYDVVFRNVHLIDGTGADGYSADVAIHNEKIAAIGDLANAQAITLIDGQNLVLSPGFVDVHTHDDTNVIRYPDCLPKISQGVTTVIVGNCGISASPAVLSDEPPDPMNLLGKQSDFVYPTFKSYAEAVEAAIPAVNVAALVGHTTLRNNVMDELHRPASGDEITAMKNTLHQAMAEGAIGLSSGLAYASAKQAPTEEVMALAEELAEFGGIYTTHMRTEFEQILEAMDEAFRTGKHAKVPVVISHLKCAGAGNWGRTVEVLELMDHTAKHQDVCCDCYPYSASSSTLDLKQVTSDFDIFITWSDPRPDLAGRMLKDIASELDLSLMDAAKALQPAGAVYHCMDEDDVERVLKYRLSMVGSDGLPNDPHPHPRLWGTFPKVLGHYSRERQLFSLPTAVHKMTGMSAKRFGLSQRGEIKEGNFADLVLFDPSQIKDEATFENPVAAARGIHLVMVNGKISYQNGQVATARHGRMLYRNK